MDRDVSADLERICRETGIIGLWVFGSRAEQISAAVRGLPEVIGPEESDLDVGVLFPRGDHPDAQARVRIVAAIEDLFSVPRVDLIVLNEASAFLAVDAIQGEQLVDLAPRATAEFELYVLRRGADLMPFRRAKTEAVLKEGAR